MSSHREAPEIAKDPVADSTDVYAFVSPDKPGTVTLIANYIPLQSPAGGPNFYEFGDDVLYEIHVDNNGDGRADVSFQFRFRTTVRNPIGVWTTASRQRVRLWDADNGENVDSGPFRQVSRLGNPLVNEVLIPLGHKDQWNSLPPSDDKRFAAYVTQPGLAALLPVLYPGVFPNLAALVKSAKPRADLEAILLTGIPAGIIKGFTNFTGTVLADMLRLNTSVPPTPSAKQSIYGLLGGDAAGFPNGRRVTDDVVAIELRALAGVTYPLIDKTFKPDAAAGQLTDGLTPGSVHAPYLGHFPYLGVPYSGYNEPS